MDVFLLLCPSSNPDKPRGQKQAGIYEFPALTKVISSPLVVQFTATGPGVSRSLSLKEVYAGINFHHRTYSGWQTFDFM